MPNETPLRSARPSTPPTPFTLALAALVLLLAGSVAAQGSDFEADDGNLTKDATRDWADLADSPRLVVGRDRPSGQEDDSFQGKEDDPAPNVVTGSVPNNKSDLLRFYAMHERLEANQHDYLYIGWVRDNTLGTANIDFEFNQAAGTGPNGVTPPRTDGDLLITFAFSSGGNQVVLGQSRWTETGPCESGNSGPCWGPVSPLSGVAEGAVNSSPVVDPIAGVTMPELTFGEAMIDLTAAGIFDREACLTFGSAQVKSRSSDSFTASMKDFIRPIDVSVSNCATLTVTKNAVPDSPQSFEFTPANEISPSTFHLVDDGTDIGDPGATRTFEGQFSGALTLRETPTEGWDLTSIACDSEATIERDESGFLTGLVTVATAIGDETSCTFVNTQRGRILVDEITVPDADPHLFQFALSGGADGIKQDFGLTDASPLYDAGQLRPGTYSLLQGFAGTGWDLTSATCDDGSTPDSVDLAPGQTVICTFVNTRRATLIVAKTAIGDDGTFAYTSSTLAPFNLTTASGVASESFVDLAPGTYDVAETAATPDWDLTSASCSDGSAPDAIGLDPGETVTCTFVNTRRATLIVAKTAIGDDGTFEYTSSTLAPFSLTTAGGSASTSLENLVPGTYDVTEVDATPEWDLTSASCSDGSAPDAIGLEAGETVTCTFVNTRRATLIVTKSAIGADGTFDYTSSSLAPFSLTTVGGTASANFDNLAPGAYDVTETAATPEWDLTAASCSDGSAPDAINLEPGESVTCSFVNTRRATLIVTKIAIGGDGVFEFTSSSLAPLSLTTAGGTASTSIDNLLPGTYDLEETDARPEWDLTSTSCSDGSAPGAIELEPGETVTCTFVNTRRATLIVAKTSIGADGTFEYTSSTLAPFNLTTVGGAASTNFENITPGTYDVTETDATPEWDLTSASCSDGSAPGAIELEPGETVTCTFVNRRRATLIVAKTAIGADGTFDYTSSTLSPFSLTTTGGAASTTIANLTPGTYDVTETDATPEWDLTSASCSDGSTLDAIGLEPGEMVTCTFVNTRRATLIVSKTAVGDDGTFEFTSSTLAPFSLTTAGGAATTTIHNVLPGTYDLAEVDATPEWDLTSSSCSDGSSLGAIGLQPGETVTCSFVNTRRATLIVNKSAIGADGTFAYTSSTLMPFSLTTSEGAASRIFENLTPGTYDLAETDVTPEWDLTSASCSDGSSVGAIRLEPGETVTCGFVNTRRARLIIAKTSIGADGTFSYSSSTLAPFSLTTASGAASTTIENLVPGTYDVSETDGTPVWDLTSSTCSDGSTPDAIELEAGETVICTFVNTRRATLIVTKSAVGGDATFTYTSSTLAPFSLTTAGGAASRTFENLTPGTYDLGEADATPEWDLTSASCTDGSTLGAISLQPGETVTCSFVNTRRATLIVTKNAIGGDGTFEYDSSTLDSFSLTTSDGAGSITFENIAPGTYDLTEADATPDWDLTSVSCSDGSAADAIGLEAGETVTCTFINTKRARITVIKEALPEDPQDFEFSVFGSGFSDDFTLDDDGDATDDPANGQLSDRRSMLVTGGSYTMAEDDPGTAWDLTAISCETIDGAAVGHLDLANRAASVELEPGDSVVCVFTNTKRGRIVVEKSIANLPVGYAFDPAGLPFDFNPDYGEPFRLLHGESKESEYLKAGRRYTVFETVGRGWVVEHECTYPDGSTSSGGATANIDLAPGEVVHCSFDNFMRLHPGSSGFWRNWRNHYPAESLERVLADGFYGSPIYEGLFEGDPEELIPGAIELFDHIYDNRSGDIEQSILRELTSVMANLTVSTSDDPSIRSMQKNDDICHDCLLDFSAIPGAEQLIMSWATCALAGQLTIADVIETAEATWTGELLSAWSFDRLTDSDQTLLATILSGINHGLVVVVDPDSYPDPTCLRLPGGLPQRTTWFGDQDADGFGAAGEVTSNCDSLPPVGYAVDSGDCDDADPTVHPGATQLCDGVNNDCADPAWPSLPASEVDDDGDGFVECAGDCDDLDPARNPSALEQCNLLDDDCDGWIDDYGSGVDIDGDGIAGACDNCPDVANWSQSDVDGDGHGNVCDNCIHVDNPDQADADADGTGDVCDTCPQDYDPSSPDFDRDGVGDACDTCYLVSNAAQTDVDGDGEGDLCDLNDGVAILYFSSATTLEWDAEESHDAWNLYRGDLSTLRKSGLRYQVIGSNLAVSMECGLLANMIYDEFKPEPGQAAFYLLQGVVRGEELDGLGASQTIKQIRGMECP